MPTKTKPIDAFIPNPFEHFDDPAFRDEIVAYLNAHGHPYLSIPPKGDEIEHLFVIDRSVEGALNAHLLDLPAK